MICYQGTNPTGIVGYRLATHKVVGYLALEGTDTGVRQPRRVANSRSKTSTLWREGEREGIWGVWVGGGWRSVAKGGRHKTSCPRCTDHSTVERLTSRTVFLSATLSTETSDERDTPGGVVTASPAVSGSGSGVNTYVPSFWVLKGKGVG